MTTAACDRRPDTGAVVVSAIGGDPVLADPSRTTLDTPSRLLMDATAQGLVRFDANGQIEPGLAERWIVMDDGMTYIFRLRSATWSDGEPVTAEQVVAMLKRQIAPASRNPLAPFLSAIDSAVVMTPQVIEVQLKRPRPDLLKLFAQPELALFRLRPPSGSGPFRLAKEGRSPLLRPAVDPDRVDPDEPVQIHPERDVRLIGERAARAIARFAAHDSDLISGGTFVDWPLIATTDVAPANIRIDPAAGLFGFAIVSREGFLADVANRMAVSAGIDRAAVTQAIQNGWAPTETLLPEQIDSGAPPAAPSWTTLPFAERQARARAQVAAWTGGPIVLKIAMPAGPGATLLYAQVTANLRAIGIDTARVGPDDAADLRLIDSVAPYDSARWYLATACVLCGETAEALLTAARDAPTLAERSSRIAAADIALTEDAAFVPIARPLRWSLVALRLRQWMPNSRAWHPLNRLRAEPK